MKSYLLILLFGLCLVACAKTDTTTANESSASTTTAAPGGQIKPTITLSRERIPQDGWTKMFGKGFTPKANVQSHLKRPDGTEFREIPILTDAKGEFTHDIDSLLLLKGVHEVWVFDSTTGITSNVARFETTAEQGSKERPIP